MKTILSTLALALLISTSTLAQSNESWPNKALQKWLDCGTEYFNARDNWLAVGAAMPGFEKGNSNSPEFNASNCFLLLRAETSVVKTGKTCLKSGNPLPKKYWDKSLVKAVNKQFLWMQVDVNTQRKLVADLKSLCKDLQKEEDSFSKN